MLKKFSFLLLVPVVSLPLFSLPVSAVPAPIRNATTPSEILVNILASPAQYNGKKVVVENVNAICFANICSVTAGGQSLLLDNSSLSDEDKRRLLQCSPMGCAAKVTGTVSTMGADMGMGLPMLSVETLALPSGQTETSKIVPLEQSPDNPPSQSANPVPATPTQSNTPKAASSSVCLPNDRTLSVMEMGALAQQESRNPSPKGPDPVWPVQGSSAEQIQARKELAAIGMAWDSKLFLDALLNGDDLAIDLYLKGGMTPYTSHGGQAVIFYVIAQNKPSAEPVVGKLLQKGLDPNATVDTNACPSCFPKRQTLLQIAQRYRHPNLVNLLANAGGTSQQDCIAPTNEGQTPPATTPISSTSPRTDLTGSGLRWRVVESQAFGGLGGAENTAPSMPIALFEAPNAPTVLITACSNRPVPEFLAGDFGVQGDATVTFMLDNDPQKTYVADYGYWRSFRTTGRHLDSMAPLLASAKTMRLTVKENPSVDVLYPLDGLSTALSQLAPCE